MEEMIAHYEDTKSNTFFRETPQKLEEKREKRALLQSGRKNYGNKEFYPSQL